MTDLLPDRSRSEEETVRLERELFARRRRLGRRSARRSRRRPLLVGLLAVVVLAAGVYVVGFSPWLAATDVQVTGTEVLAPVQVREAARVPRGEPLARVDLGAVEARVSALAEVRSVTVSRAWPHGVRIAVVERQAVAVVDRGNGFRGLAADGVLFRSYSSRPGDLPLIQDEVAPGQDAGQDALREAARVAGSLPPAVLARVDHLSVRSVDHITLTMRSGRLVVWGNSSQSAAKADVLAVLVKRDSRVIDVSVPGRPTTR